MKQGVSGCRSRPSSRSQRSPLVGVVDESGQVVKPARENTADNRLGSCNARLRLADRRRHGRTGSLGKAPDTPPPSCRSAPGAS